MPHLQIESLTLTFHGHDLLVDTELELNYGRYYNNPIIVLFPTIRLL
jgi:hypothetical protein